MTIKNVDNITLAQFNTYGAKLDSRTILSEGRTFSPYTGERLSDYTIK